eukprot:CAMPEP_0174383812 /NCGR_PEP_ID=MMETSP0811_2-20130205/125501_1 /TAXON_ID=73025 ORGANISM="Eutreptiella gymnastica-like, Strain CCMP1594" /NCGR_SAMPLE_ID=MMETSP0811_2 /ASSEMBLY_ACC=CAM_ASM_000667 /LENGTH=362 /DNA_ID=CAMNT_0015537557 /DNA_START=1477 /DNA_END=2566 /DNA_ORIENTATION=+
MLGPDRGGGRAGRALPLVRGICIRALPSSGGSAVVPEVNAPFGGPPAQLSVDANGLLRPQRRRQRLVVAGDGLGRRGCGLLALTDVELGVVEPHEARGPGLSEGALDLQREPRRRRQLRSRGIRVVILRALVHVPVRRQMTLAALVRGPRGRSAGYGVDTGRMGGAVLETAADEAHQALEGGGPGNGSLALRCEVQAQLRLRLTFLWLALDERERSLADGRRTDAVFSGGAAVTTFGSAEASSPPSDVHWDVFIRCCHFTRSESPCSIAAPTAAHSKRSGGTCCSVPFVGDRLRLRQAGLRRALMRPAVPGRDPKTRLWSEISTFLGRGRVTSAEVLWSAWKWDSPGTGGNEASPVTMPRAT